MATYHQGKASKWLEGKPPCTVCGGSKWILPDDLSYLPKFDASEKPGNQMTPTTGIPVLSFVCGGCGFILQVSAKVMGLI